MEQLRTYFSSEPVKNQFIESDIMTNGTLTQLAHEKESHFDRSQSTAKETQALFKQKMVALLGESLAKEVKRKVKASLLSDLPQINPWRFTYRILQLQIQSGISHLGIQVEKINKPEKEALDPVFQARIESIYQEAVAMVIAQAEAAMNQVEVHDQTIEEERFLEEESAQTTVLELLPNGIAELYRERVVIDGNRSVTPWSYMHRLVIYTLQAAASYNLLFLDRHGDFLRERFLTKVAL